jgi:hypothetical protein
MEDVNYPGEGEKEEEPDREQTSAPAQDVDSEIT